jgi:hypothetical protein
VSSDSIVYTRIVLVFIVNSLVLLSVLSTSVSRSASAIGLEDNVKEQTDLTSTEGQQDNADPFKSKDLKEKIDKDKACSDAPKVLDKILKEKIDEDKACSDAPKVLDKKISADNKESEQKVTSGSEGNGKNHFELPIDIPFP